MQPRISLITLGVADIALGLYGRDALAEDAQAGPPAVGSGGITIAHNVGSPEEVDRVLAAAVAAGAGNLTPPG